VAGDNGSSQIAQALQHLGRVVGDLSSQLKTATEDIRTLRAELSAARGAPAAAVESGVQEEAAVGVGGTPASTLPQTAMGRLAVTSLPPSAGTPSPALTLSGVRAAELYMDVMERGGGRGGYADGDAYRVRLVMSWFNAMATQEERVFLTSRDFDGKRFRVVARLHELVVARLVKAFGVECPKKMKAQRFELGAGALEGRLKELKNRCGVTVVVDATEFQAFRKEYEAGKGAAAGQWEPQKRQRTEDPPESGGGSGSGGGALGMLGFFKKVDKT